MYVEINEIMNIWSVDDELFVYYLIVCHDVIEMEWSLATTQHPRSIIKNIQ